MAREERAREWTGLRRDEQVCIVLTRPWSRPLHVHHEWRRWRFPPQLFTAALVTSEARTHTALNQNKFSLCVTLSPQKQIFGSCYGVLQIFGASARRKVFRRTFFGDFFSQKSDNLQTQHKKKRPLFTASLMAKNLLSPPPAVM